MDQFSSDNNGESGNSNRYAGREGVSQWRRRSKLEKVLLLACGSLLLITLVTSCLALETATHGNENIHNSDSSPCLTPACIHTASSVMAALDPDKDPCHDFYEFACGGWIRNNPVPGASIWDNIGNHNTLIIRKALEQNNSAKPSSAETKAKIFYDACLDSNGTIEALGASPLLDVIRKLGGWDLLPETMLKLNRISLQEMLQQMQNRYRVGGLFSWAVAEDYNNSSKHVIELKQVGFSWPNRGDYLDSTANKNTLDAYLESMTRMCELLGVNKTDAKVHMQKVIDFETELANITTPKEERIEWASIAEWQNVAPFINWLAFFNDAFNQVNKSITEKELIVVHAPEYFKKLTTVLNTYRRTEDGQKVLTSYMMWTVSRSLSTYLSTSFRDKKIVSVGAEKELRDCIKETVNAFGFVTSAMFVRSTIHSDSKTQVKVMVNNIRKAFKDNFKNLRWLDEETRRAAEIKADSITDMIGFPDFILNPVELDEYYAELEVAPYKYFANNINVKFFDLKTEFLKIDQPVNNMDWTSFKPSDANAYYTPAKNQISIPAGILQPPMYGSDNPKSVNYGALGMILGHELTHAFDDRGRQYDRFGKHIQWWNNATIERFKEQTTCLEQQYSNYTYNGLQLNGTQTLGDDIADNGGLKAAYHAYLVEAGSAPRNLTLPGLHYTHTQTFFISFAQMWCSAFTQEQTKKLIESDEHSISKYRVIGALSNLKEFAQEFRCPAGSNMNPRDKCEVW